MIESTPCPCAHTTPCHERCTCVTPLSSSGCRRCCAYGSAEQRAAQAARLAALIDLGQEKHETRQAPSIHESRRAPAIHALREVLVKHVEHVDVLRAMLDELAQLRAKERLRVDSAPASMDDLPPDGATGLYLDRPFDADDLTWVKMAWDAYLPRGSGNSRASQLMLVFHAIRCDERATREFLRLMNTSMLPLLRRLRLSVQPDLLKLGAADE